MRPQFLTALLIALPLFTAACGTKESPTAPVIQPAYDLKVRWLGAAPSAVIQQAFTRAETRIKAIIVGGLSPVLIPTDFNVSQCDAALTGYPNVPVETVKGILIYVLIKEIDGIGKVLGSAGPCLVRDQDRFKPALGIMRLDAADLQNFATQDRLDALILHEMLHVVGIGTIWTDNSLLIGDQTADSRFVGARARTACAEVHGGTTTCATNVPVHSADGTGSAYSHWRETTFTNELMTPFLNSGAVPLSEMSIQSLADIGYVVRTQTADAFGPLASNVMANALAAEAYPSVALPEPTRPRFTVSASGGLTPLRR